MRINFSATIKHKLILQKPTVVPDGAGGFTRSWKDACTLWGSISKISGKETFFAKKLGSNTSHRVHIRYTNEITPGMRFLYGDRIFTIRTVFNVMEANKILEIGVEENANS